MPHRARRARRGGRPVRAEQRRQAHGRHAHQEQRSDGLRLTARTPAGKRHPPRHRAHNPGAGSNPTKCECDLRKHSRKFQMIKIGASLSRSGRQSEKNDLVYVRLAAGITIVCFRGAHHLLRLSDAAAFALAPRPRRAPGSRPPRRFFTARTRSSSPRVLPRRSNPASTLRAPPPAAAHHRRRTLPTPWARFSAASCPRAVAAAPPV